MKQRELKNLYSSNLKAIKKELRYTTKELSDKLGVSKRSLDSYEQGLCIPTAQLITALCEILNINANWFCTGNGEMLNKNKNLSNKEELREVFKELLIEYKLIK